ncbi:MAG: hypothetical protein DMG32_24495 [Acidobacteria bacterium]|nr:MAG: hypothetical protein DMG32_24495 [Acidobacteriota bacterium]
MAIHEHLPKVPKSELKLMGWTKARELVKVVRSDGRELDCAPWVHKAIDLPGEEFKREVEKHLTGRESEPWEILYFINCWDLGAGQSQRIDAHILNGL